ncbi:MAG TPA: flagellar FlbD family protein [bacterium]|nr:flagellar FlbD family protein [bacterium]
MIILTRLNDTQFYANPHQIEFLEETPDTIITMLSGKKVVVKNKAAEIIKRIIEYRKEINIMDTNDLKREKEI